LKYVARVAGRPEFRATEKLFENIAGNKSLQFDDSRLKAHVEDLSNLIGGSKKGVS
jgi:hypothetical protein